MLKSRIKAAFLLSNKNVTDKFIIRLADILNRV